MAVKTVLLVAFFLTVKTYLLTMNNLYEIVVINENDVSFNINLTRPSFYVFATDEEQAIKKMLESDFWGKDMALHSIKVVA